MADHGTFHWNELFTSDVEKAKAFYAETLGWTFDAMPMADGAGNYILAKMGEAIVGGIFPKPPAMAEVPDHWFAYIAVDDVDKRLKALKAAGGTVVKEPFDVPGVGRIVIVTDVNGAAHGWMTPAG